MSQKIKNSSNGTNKKIISIALTIALLIIIGGIIFNKPKTDPSSVNNVEIKDGVQYVTITAQGGYFPNISEAQAGIPTKLIIETKNAYDCSSSLVIPALGYQKLLPKTGKTEIDLGTPASGPFQGLCSMGMYSFKINFN